MKSLEVGVGKRLSGEQVSALRAFAAATSVGVTTGVLVYRLLRH
jgi:hypothetical protein